MKTFTSGTPGKSRAGGQSARRFERIREQVINDYYKRVGQHFNEVTETFERKVSGSLVTRLEFRRDMSNQPAFVKGTAPVKAQNTVAAGLVYTFDMKELH